MTYTIGEVSKISGFSVSTLRYYDEMGMFPFLTRDEQGNRVFTDGAVEWLRFVKALKLSGMTVPDMASYIKRMVKGDSTLKERMAQAVEQKRKLLDKIVEHVEGLEVLNYTIWYYETSLAAGTEHVLYDDHRSFGDTYDLYVKHEQEAGENRTADDMRRIVGHLQNLSVRPSDDGERDS